MASKKHQQRSIGVGQAKALGAINGRIREAYQAGQDDGVHQAVVLVLFMLHDKYGFGKKRLTDMYHQLLELSDSVIHGYVSFDDIEQVLADECKIKVNKSGGE